MKPMSPEVKAKIDAMDRVQLLTSCANDPVGTDIWTGDAGKYAQERMKALGATDAETYGAALQAVDAYFRSRAIALQQE